MTLPIIGIIKKEQEKAEKMPCLEFKQSEYRQGVKHKKTIQDK